MDLFDVLLNIGVLTTALVLYLIFFKKSSPSKLRGNYRQPSWNYHLRLFSAKRAVKRWKSSLPKSQLEETPRTDQKDGWDCMSFRTSAPDGSSLILAIRKVYGIKPVAELTVYVKLSDGTAYKLPQHPDTVVGTWEGFEGGWTAGGLKIEVLEPKSILRIIYNGLVTRLSDNITQHATFNFIWSSGAKAIRHPEDWSDDLAAQALALDPWRDDQWHNILGIYGGGGWHQWGAVQGRFQSYDSQGAVERSEYLQTRGVKERSWSPHGYQGLRRSVNITAAAKDGTCVQLQGLSYRDNLTIAFNGSVRFPDFSVSSITDTNLILSEFCEHPDGVLKSYCFNVSTDARELKIVLRINDKSGHVVSGVPRQHRTVYGTFTVDIDGETGTGILQLGYEITGELKPVHVPAAPLLRWLSEQDAGSVCYCVPFESQAAACPALVGGKGASLALLSTVQREQGYRVPPGYCLTIKALEKQLDANPQITAAIKEIEAATVDYDENNFKDKCNKTVHLLTTTTVVDEVREEIVSHLKELRSKALQQNFGPELRFAVRSSAVGEDSEALSAAGQNESILGCASDEDVVRAVQQCWASMFAFTSAHYRRQNGQPCLCGGAVVVQTLCDARAAGVMFTRHPAAGDTTRLLITANYGLGESVVSGSVEPDTIIVSRGADLTVSKIELGSKKQRVTPSGNGVGSEEVPESERSTPCLSMSEALRLAMIGVAQETLWGAPRDIEWAISKDEIFLLQARPITSLERWTEEELLHEMDTAIMSDDELTTFANTGEVLPKPSSSMTYDIVCLALANSPSKLIYGADPVGYDRGMFFTHQRTVIASYNTMYRFPTAEIDMQTRMLEMSIHGHTVADQNVINVAKHRRPRSRWNMFMVIWYSLKHFLLSKKAMKKAIEIVNNMDLDVTTTDPMKALKELEDSCELMTDITYYHCITTTASASTQLVAMMVLVEGASDFTTEQCSEMNTLLSAGDVLSAEVPQELAKLAKQLEESGKVEEFRTLDPKEAMTWLSANLPDVYKNISTFLEQHGYRAVMEFDLATKPWVLVPEEMIEVLQNMRSREDGDVRKVTKTDADIIKELKTPKKSSTRRILSWIMPQCRRTVQEREVTKAHVILVVHKLRLLARRLGHLLVKQWYLPDLELVFHFRLHELKQYILTRDPALLRKVSQRRQYHSSWCKLRFAEVNAGWVRPLQSRGPAVRAGDVTVSATGVCGGDVVARACVIKSLTEIGQLQRGDILITHSTDIGWSPYFPLIAGIVTELGGLISHGAVIAREYGLPCIIGAADATDIFKTGDTVRLSGTNGTIERVKIEDEAFEDPENTSESKLEANAQDSLDYNKLVGADGTIEETVKIEANLNEVTVLTSNEKKAEGNAQDNHEHVMLSGVNATSEKVKVFDKFNEDTVQTANENKSEANAQSSHEHVKLPGIDGTIESVEIKEKPNEDTVQTSNENSVMTQGRPRPPVDHSELQKTVDP